MDKHHKLKVARRSEEHTATVEPNSNNTKLRVGFFGQQPTSSNYWIVEIADDYSYAVTSDPTKTTFWILSRTPQMDETKVQDILNTLIHP